MSAGYAPICLGWQYSRAVADPGPAPASAVAETAPVAARLDSGWVDAQYRIYRKLGRPARLGAAVCTVTTAVLAAAWLAGVASAPLACAGTVAAMVGEFGCARSALSRQRRLRAVIAAERRRIEAISVGESAVLASGQREHAREYRAWQRRKAIFDRQPSWFAVPIPAGIDRLDVVGGTLTGWSALLATIATTQLGAGGEVTVVDLTEGVVAGDLVSLAGQSGIRPLVWVLPSDLPRFDLGTDLEAPALADVLALAAGAQPSQVDHRHRGSAEFAADCALLERVLQVLGPDRTIAQLTAALRVLANVGDPRADLRAGLITGEQVERVGTLFGRGSAERVVIERAWALESRLRSLDSLGSARTQLPASPLRVAALDRRSGLIGNRTLGTYLVAALTQALRQAPAGQPWRHTLCLFGAERLGADLVEAFTDACEASHAGLVLAYRSIPAPVRERLGRGNAAVAFMRLGNGDDARAASELIGTEHRFVISQLTDTVGRSLTDTWGDSYTSTVGTADSVAGSFSVSHSRGTSTGRGRSYQGGFSPFGDSGRSASGESNDNVGRQSSLSLTAGINSGTSWGLSTSRALAGNSSLGRTMQRSREFLVEPDELQRLPSSAAILSYPARAGRTVLLVDANPAIITLDDATMNAAVAEGQDG